MFIQRSFWLLLTCLAIAGCATTAPPPLDPEQQLAQWQLTQQQLGKVKSWRLRGKMGVKTGPKGGSATLKWSYAENNQRIELYGPFGGGRVIISVDESGAELRDTKGRIIRGATASEVLYQRLGWQVPFDYLADWARGLPGEGARDIQLDDQGRLKQLVQDNWQVNYTNYKSFDSGTELVTLPTKLVVSALPGTMEIYSDKGEYLGDELNVKVILKRWWEIGFDQS